MFQTSYGFTKTLNGTRYDEAIVKVTDALKTEGFGVLTEIDVKATLKAKLGAEFRPYKILGACNPQLAKQALETELPIGLLLPCNVVVLEGDSGDAVVAIAKPSEMFKIVTNPDLEVIAGEVETKLQRVLEAL